MKIVSFIAFTGLLLHGCSNICTAQPLTTDTAIHVSTIMQVRPTAVRIAVNPIDHALYYATFQGGLYKIRKQGSVYSDTLIATATQHHINYLQSIAFKDSNIYLLGNRKAPNTAGHGLVMRGKFKPNGTWQWDTLMYTVNYPSTATLFDHAFSSLCVSANGDSLYIGSGSRTDHGEVQTSNGLFPNSREVGLTSTVFRIPINPAAPVYLPNDSATLASGPYVYCRGVRNSFDMALAPNGDLLASENSGDRDDPEELNWLRKGGHYGFPWRMGGNLTGMQFSNYNQNNDLLINHNCLAWTNGYFYNDLNYPQPPGLITFSEPVKNYGPDGDKFRNANTGHVHDASDEGTFITSFTPHRSPLGLVFDINGKLTAPYNHGAFIMSYTEGTADASGTLPNGSTGPFSDVGQDLLQLALFKDTASGQYSMNCYRIAWDFKNPVDACLDDNVLYVIESHYPGNPVTPKLYALTFPLNTNGGNSAFLPKDSVICSGNSITIAPNIKGKWNYQWSNGATTAQIAVSPTAHATYWLKINNGITMSTDTIVISVSKPPTIPSTISLTGGIAKVCPGSTRTYTVSLTAGVTYNWIVPAGATINSGQGTRSINLTYTNGFTANDTLTVIKVNSCGSSPERNLIIQRNLPSTPGAITGNTFGLCGAMSQSYSASSVTAGVTYNWTVPTGATITNGQGTNSINVDFPSSVFTNVVSVKADNGCGESNARTLIVRTVPAAPVAINGPAIVCSNSSENDYSITTVNSATSYTWTGPSGSHITGNGITSSNNILTTTAMAVEVSYSTITNSSTLKVKANNFCGSGTNRTLNLQQCTPRLLTGKQITNFDIFPNPANNYIIISFSVKQQEYCKLVITDLSGRIILTKQIFASVGDNQYPVNLDLMSNGIYIVRLTNTENTLVKRIALE